MTRLAGKRCLVTGGSRGLGRALAVTFAREGARVAFTYSTHDGDAAEAARLVAEAGGGQAPRVFKGSVADAAHCKATVDALAREWGGLDVLVNCAGVTQVLPISLLEEADWDRVMDVNVKGAYLMSRAALRHMIRQKAGVVLMIGNFASERVIEAPVHYAASKSALRGFTEALAREVGRHGIRVNLLAPGLLDVGMALALPQHRQDEFARRSPLGRAGRADEVAAAAAFLCSDGAALVSGAKVTLDGGL